MKSIIDAKTPAKIAFMEDPPAKGGEIKYLTPEEFQQKFNCEYTESIVVKQLTREPATELDFKDARAKAAYARLLHPLENLVICKMTNEVGYGLFTTEIIPMGTVICLYAGEYDPKTAEFVYSCGGINAARIGGVARFMQHQPISKNNHEAYLMQGLQDYRLFAIQENIPKNDAQSLLNDSDFVAKKRKEYTKKVEGNQFFGDYNFDQYKFSDKQIIDQIAQSNVAIESTQIAGVDVVLMVASCDIKKNESIGFSYGSMYWQHPSIHKPPFLFTKTGQIILPENHYTYKNHKATKEAISIVKTNPFLSSYSPFNQEIQYGSEKTEDSKDARQQKLEKLSQTLKEMERNYDSEEDDYYLDDSDDSEEEEYLANEERFADPDDQLIKLINLMQSLPINTDTKLSQSTKPLEKKSPVKPNTVLRKTEEVETKLQYKTRSFFGNPTNTTNTQWKKYPESGLVGKYVGHQLLFFTMAANETTKAKVFAEQLQKEGFDAELKRAKDKPSVVVDLTTSILTLK